MINSNLKIKSMINNKKQHLPVRIIQFTKNTVNNKYYNNFNKSKIELNRIKLK